MSSIEDRFAPYPSANVSTPELLKQVGEVQFSFCVTPISDGLTTPYATDYVIYYAHLATHGLIVEAKANEKEYETEKKFRTIAGWGIGLAGLGSGGYRGMAQARKEINDRNYLQAIARDNEVSSTLYEDIEKFDLEDPYFKIYFESGDTMLFLPDYVPGRAPGIIYDRTKVAKVFIERANSLKELSSRSKSIFTSTSSTNSPKSKSTLVVILLLAMVLSLFYNWKIDLVLVPIFIIFTQFAKNSKETN